MDVPEAVRVHARPPARGICPWCRHDLAGEDVATCDGCRTPSHRACLAHWRRCPTLGCDRVAVGRGGALRLEPGDLLDDAPAPTVGVRERPPSGRWWSELAEAGWRLVCRGCGHTCGLECYLVRRCCRRGPWRVLLVPRAGRPATGLRCATCCEPLRAGHTVVIDVAGGSDRLRHAACAGRDWPLFLANLESAGWGYACAGCGYAWDLASIHERACPVCARIQDLVVRRDEAPPDAPAAIRWRCEACGEAFAPGERVTIRGPRDAHVVCVRASVALAVGILAGFAAPIATCAGLLGWSAGAVVLASALVVLAGRVWIYRLVRRLAGGAPP